MCVLGDDPLAYPHHALSVSGPVVIQAKDHVGALTPSN